VSQTE